MQRQFLCNLFIRYIQAHEIQEGVSDLLILHSTTSFGRVWTFQFTKEPFRRVFCAVLGIHMCGKGGGTWPKTLHESMQGRSCCSARGAYGQKTHAASHV